MLEYYSELGESVTYLQAGMVHTNQANNRWNAQYVEQNQAEGLPWRAFIHAGMKIVRQRDETALHCIFRKRMCWVFYQYHIHVETSVPKKMQLDEWYSTCRCLHICTSDFKIGQRPINVSICHMYI